MLRLEHILNCSFKLATDEAHCRPEVSKLILTFAISKSVQDEIQDLGREGKTRRHSGLCDFRVGKAKGKDGQAVVMIVLIRTVYSKNKKTV